MKPTAEVTRDREQTWRERMARWEHTGLSQQEFCDQEKIKLTTFGYWRRELKRRKSDLGRRRSLCRVQSPEFFQRMPEILRQRGFEGQRFSGFGMLEREPKRMESLAAEKDRIVFFRDAGFQVRLL